MNLRLHRCKTVLFMCAAVSALTACSVDTPSSTNPTTSASATTTTTSSSSSSSASPGRETLTADTSRPNNSTFVLGENVELTFKASGLVPAKATTISVKVSDEFNAEIASTSLAITANASGQATATFAAPATKYGYYRVAATLAGGGSLASLGTRPAGFLTYSVVTDPSARVNYGDSGTRFGIQGGFSGSQGDVLRYLGVRYLLDGPGWRSLEPNYAGQFATKRLDGQEPAIVSDPAQSAESGTWPTYAVPLVTMAQLPSWAMEAGTAGTICKTMGALNSAGVEAFPGFTQNLAEAVAKSYPNQSAHYYQITWEPAKGWCFGGTPQQLVQFYQLSYAAIHKSDSKAVVMGPTLFPGDSSTLSQLWAAGLGNYVDAVSMHPYAAFPPEANNLVSDIRTQMKAAAEAKGHSVPFVGTEHGYTSSSIGELNEALGDIRSTLILLGEGFKFDIAFYIADFWITSPGETKNTYGYYWNLNPKLNYGTNKLGPKPAAPALAAMTSLLDGTSTGGVVANLAGTQIGYRFKRNGTTILALWDYQEAASELSLPSPNEDVRICDWMGNCEAAASNGTINLQLGPSPTYIVGDNL
jgi:hypothetical protein